MKKEAVLDYFIFDGIQHSMDSSFLFNSIEGLSIYEVVRIINGVPLFLEDHLSRMRTSAELLGYSIKKLDQEIAKEIYSLVQVNNCSEMNVKLLCSNMKEEEQHFFTYFIESHYPQSEVYEEGVTTVLYHSERSNPNAKTVNVDLREGVNIVMRDENAFEGLLVNKAGYITEGSRSNVFFVKDKHVYTAPPDKVLMGVTRMRIMNICKNQSISIEEKAIHEDMLNEMDAAFISGTSINVLPVGIVGSKVFNSVNNGIIKRISKGYLDDMNDYILQNIR